MNNVATAIGTQQRHLCSGHDLKHKIPLSLASLSCFPINDLNRNELRFLDAMAFN